LAGASETGVRGVHITACTAVLWRSALTRGYTSLKECILLYAIFWGQSGSDVIADWAALSKTGNCPHNLSGNTANGQTVFETGLNILVENESNSLGNVMAQRINANMGKMAGIQGGGQTEKPGAVSGRQLR
jgi:hypothetical protein